MYIHSSSSPRELCVVSAFSYKKCIDLFRSMYEKIKKMYNIKYIKRTDENKCFNRSNLRQRQSFFFLHFFRKCVCKSLAGVPYMCLITKIFIANTFTHKNFHTVRLFYVIFLYYCDRESELKGKRVEVQMMMMMYKRPRQCYALFFWKQNINK